MTRTARAADGGAGRAEYGPRMRLRSALGGYVVDLLVGVVLVISLLEVWLEDEIHGSPWALTLFAFAWTLPLFARRRFPVAAPAATLILLGVQVAIWDHSVPYSFGAYMMALIATSQFGLLGLTVQGLAGAALTALVIAFAVLRNPEGDAADVFFVNAIAAPRS